MAMALLASSRCRLRAAKRHDCAKSPRVDSGGIPGRGLAEALLLRHGDIAGPLDRLRLCFLRVRRGGVLQTSRRLRRSLSACIVRCGSALFAVAGTDQWPRTGSRARDGSEELSPEAGWLSECGLGVRLCTNASRPRSPSSQRARRRSARNDTTSTDHERDDDAQSYIHPYANSDDVIMRQQPDGSWNECDGTPSDDLFGPAAQRMPIVRRFALNDGTDVERSGFGSSSLPRGRAPSLADLAFPFLPRGRSSANG